MFAASLVVFGWHVGRADIATSYVDPIARIQEQDEAVYASTTFEMASDGDWLTPEFLGRYALYKPPLLYWASVPWVWLLGPTRTAVRAIPVVAGAATAALIFWWLRALLPLASALTGALLLLSSHLFFIVSRTGLTDALLCLEIVVAMVALMRDPRLESRAAVVVFGCATGAAIMTKAAAGAIPILILGVYCVIGRPRPNLRRLAASIGIAAAIALPWHVWQLAVHPRWFWNEYVLTELLAKGTGAPLQTTHESQAAYYLKRLVFLDPVLFAAALVAAYRIRSRILLSWALVVVATALAFHYRNTTYILPLIPAMAIAAASAIPKGWARAALIATCAVLVFKIAAPDAIWGIPFTPESANPSARALESYAALHRPNDLILIDPDDQFYSADLPLAHVRYCFIDTPADPGHAPLDFHYLGITVTAAQFDELDRIEPVFAERLKAWGLNSTNPIATVILAKKSEVAKLIAAHPESDFFLPPQAFVPSGDHDLWHPEGGRTFLLSKERGARPFGGMQNFFTR